MWIDKITGDLDTKKRWKAYKSRVKQLPPSYRDTAAALERYLLYFGPTNDGKSLITMVTDLADLLEQSAADGIGVRGLVGSDPVEFAETFVSNYDGGSWITKERDRLAHSIDRAVEEEHPGGRP